MSEAIVRYTSALSERSQQPCTVSCVRDRRSIRMTTVSAADPMAVETILQTAAGAVLPRCLHAVANLGVADALGDTPQSAEMLAKATGTNADALRSEEHTSELQSLAYLVCRLLLEKKKKK